MDTDPTETNTLSISVVADATGVSAYALRYYERIGLIPEVEPPTLPAAPLLPSCRLID